VNRKGLLQAHPVTLPGGEAFIQWRIDLLTEREHVAHMTKAIDNIMVVGLNSELSPPPPSSLAYLVLQLLDG